MRGLWVKSSPDLCRQLSRSGGQEQFLKEVRHILRSDGYLSSTRSVTGIDYCCRTRGRGWSRRAFEVKLHSFGVAGRQWRFGKFAPQLPARGVSSQHKPMEILGICSKSSLPRNHGLQARWQSCGGRWNALPGTRRQKLLQTRITS